VGHPPTTAAPQNQSEQNPPAQNPPSWKPGQPFPNDPSGLGPDWRKNDKHQDPNGEQWVNDKTGEKVDFHKGRPGETGKKQDDHWHYHPPGGEKGKDHIKPGEIGKLLRQVSSGISQTIMEHPVTTGVVVVSLAIITLGTATPEEALILGGAVAAKAGAGP
jgi:hypothetical protein